MRAEHTPGPWFVNGPWHIQADTKTAIPVIVAQITPLRSGDNEEREANARLIAAAPELLEALEEALEVLRVNGLDPLGQDNIRAIVAKAKGATL